MWIIDPLRIDLWGFDQCNVLVGGKSWGIIRITKQKESKRLVKVYNVSIIIHPLF